MMGVNAALESMREGMAPIKPTKSPHKRKHLVLQVTSRDTCG